MKRWPALPKTVYGAGGSIAVREVAQPKSDEGEDAFGTWEPETRTIEIEAGSNPRHKWHVYYHEWMHAVLADSGLVNLLADDAQETLCDAVATARVVEMCGNERPTTGGAKRHG